jgi:hypothetical protein
MFTESLPSNVSISHNSLNLHVLRVKMVKLLERDSFDSKILQSAMN